MLQRMILRITKTQLFCYRNWQTGYWRDFWSYGSVLSGAVHCSDSDHIFVAL